MSSLDAGELFAGRYRVVREVGRGGMGVVYLAHDERVGDDVALKVLPASFDPRARERLRQEARLARRVSHENVARIHDLGEDQGGLFLTMAYVPGRPLDQVLASEGAQPPGRAAGIARDLADAIAAVHAQGVVHRDLKPANCQLTPRGRVVLLDFGIARALHEASASRFSGTPVYMAPEQCLGEATDGRADVYSLGAILYELLTGEAPFRGASRDALLTQKLEGSPPDPRGRRNVPAELARLVRRCLARDPTERPASASALEAALLSFATITLSPGAPAPALASPAGLHATPAEDLGLEEWRESAPTEREAERAVAVLPFRFRGEGPHAFLAEALSDELIDLLMLTRGLRVVLAPATERDPRTLAATLGVEAVVDGVAQIDGARVRVKARLVGAEDATPLWSGRFDGELGDLFEVQERLGMQIAEALRVGFTTAVHAGDAPREAVALYLRARAALRDSHFSGASGAVGLLEAALARAPALKPAMSAHAIACLRAWFIPGLDQGRDWAEAAQASVRRARAQAGMLAESHLAAGILAVQEGRYATANADLRRALALDPRLVRAHADLARQHGLHGRVEAHTASLAALFAATRPDYLPALREKLRVGAWSRNARAVEEVLEVLGRDPGPDREMMRVYAQGVLGRLALADVEGVLLGLAGHSRNPRFHTFVRQLLTEVATAQGDAERAGDHLAAAAETSLVDVGWVEACGLLDGLRGDVAFAGVRRTVRARAQRIWR
ncbi:MAG: serine/threonine-protein kinase [Myxococcota bacterium]